MFVHISFGALAWCFYTHTTDRDRCLLVLQCMQELPDIRVINRPGSLGCVLFRALFASAANAKGIGSNMVQVKVGASILVPMLPRTTRHAGGWWRSGSRHFSISVVCGGRNSVHSGHFEGNQRLLHKGHVHYRKVRFADLGRCE